LRGDFRIGEWIIHPNVNSLERDGKVVHLEPKVMHVLRALASEPGEVVPRDRLRTAVWPDVFVGEDVLIRAISELRRAFSDDPRSPHTIETIPKVGYRLIVPVSGVSLSSPTEPGSSIVQTAEVTESARAEAAGIAVAGKAPAFAPPRSRIGASKFGPRLLLPAIALLVSAGVIWATFAIRSAYHSSNAAGTYISRPLTTYPGSELTATFAPDGSAIAFVWRKEAERHGHIYVKLLSSEAPVRLTAGSADEICPAWSPNGRWIAFIRHYDTRSVILIIPAEGGSEREVYQLPTNSVWEYGGLVWTPDGDNLIFPQRKTVEAPSQLVELSLNDRTVHTLTAPQQGWDGDWTPAISPDGTKLAFVRGAELFGREIYTMDLPNGPPHQLTHDGSLIVGLTWSADGSSLIFSSSRRGELSLWRISSRGGTPERLPVGGDDAYGPSIARRGNRLVYAQGSAAWKIIGTYLGGKDREAEVEILASSVQDASPHISPSGEKIAFQSWRSGSQEIWTSGIDGSNPVQLTSRGAMAGSPAWSRDGQRIAFDARPDSFAHIYVIDATGGVARTITQGHYNDIVPAWSADGRWLYFGSNRSGSWQIWKVPSDASGPAEQVTTEGGMVARESDDGHWLYFTKYGESGIWRRATSGGPERKIFDGPPDGSQNYWTLGRTSLYSLSDRGGQFSLQRIDPETGHTQTVHDLKHDPTPFAGLSIAPDRKLIVFAELARASSDLTLVEHFK
jgi:Tol biopolymer transport system component/DNA-binding winged helix-turn-helix (wHTH) protein